MRYTTDKGDEIGKGTLHWIRIASPKTEYIPTEELDNLMDYGVTAPVDVPKPSEQTDQDQPPPILPVPALLASKDESLDTPPVNTPTSPALDNVLANPLGPLKDLVIDKDTSPPFSDETALTVPDQPPMNEENPAIQETMPKLLATIPAAEIITPKDIEPEGGVLEDPSKSVNPLHLEIQNQANEQKSPLVPPSLPGATKQVEPLSAMVDPKVTSSEDVTKPLEPVLPAGISDIAVGLTTALPSPLSPSEDKVLTNEKDNTKPLRDSMNIVSDVAKKVETAGTDTGDDANLGTLPTPPSLGKDPLEEQKTTPSQNLIPSELLGLVEEPSKAPPKKETTTPTIDLSDTDSDEEMEGPITILRKQPSKTAAPRRKKNNKRVLPIRRNEHRVINRIDRFKPKTFSTAKRRKTVPKKKEENEIPFTLSLAVKKQVCNEKDVEVDNLLHVGASTMGIGNTPLEFLGNPELYDKHWSMDIQFGKDIPNHTKSLKFSKELLSLPTSARAFQALLAKTKGKDAKRELQRWYRQGLKDAALEADLMLLDSVKKIAWIPEKAKPTQQKLKGHYAIVVARHDGSLETIVPTNDWMAQNFKQEVLAAVQRVAYQRKESLMCIDANDSTSQHSGYINVEKEGITCSETDKRVVNRLKYAPERKRSTGPTFTTNKKGEKVRAVRDQIIIPHQWNGYCNATSQNIRLQEEWVKKNFQPGFLKQVISATGAGTPYVLVPPGDSRPQSQQDMENAGPKIKYQQNMGDKTCMSLALANALHFLGEKEMAHCIFSKSKQCEKQAWSIRQFCTNLRMTYKKLNKIEFPKPSMTSLFDPIGHLHLVTILGNDGKEDHCIALTHQWIFDPNFSYALPRTKTSLDLCCSSTEVSSLFVRAVSIAVFPKVTTK